MKTVSLFFLQLFFFFLIPQTPSFSGENALFSKTHLLPSPYTLPAGTLVYGTYLGYGITDFLQVGTHLLKNFYQIYNADAKLSLLDYVEVANAFTFGVEYTNLNNISSANKDIYITSYQPGIVFATELHPRVALFFGGHLNINSIGLEEKDLAETTGWIQGTTLQTDLTFMYNPPKKTKSGALITGNALSAGLTYDTLFHILGLGVSHHWQTFQLGIHYYLNADKNNLQPILVGGGSMSF